MQIPPGTVRPQENKVHLGTFLENLRATHFTGCCVITLRGQAWSLIFSGGKCLLAESQDHRGETAWREILRMEPEKVDAVLSVLTPGQVELTVNFNRPFLTDETIQEASPKVQQSTTVIKPVAAKGMPGRRVKVSAVSTSPAAADGHTPSIDARGEPQRKRAVNVEGVSDRISMESLKGLKESFKADVATLLKDLDLEHLMVDIPEKENVKKNSQDMEKKGC